ncbi:alanyl-tRNA synthetase [Streptococcus pneumoniae]|uniref:alanine--tRNA ligase n=15 Tax=Bacteria TaxID=2 RepID=UPI00061BCB57|nr:alanyl-tRNA synthetase [Streptococcus pneumoniae]
MKQLSSAQVRQMWLDFWATKGHSVEPSVSLVPVNDPTLLWINSGVATLKKYFDGTIIPENPRITNAQKAIRTNDIENVGKTARHHTMFEMLGNFSIGDYFRDEAITWAYELLTSPEWFDFPAEKLYMTYYPDDKDSYNRWIEVGVDPSHLIPIEDNFWEIGAGPSGPDTEIFFDRGEAFDPENIGLRLLAEDIENDRYIEIWNIVLSQFNADPAVPRSEYKELPHKNIDTGAGLERLVAVIQGAKTNFETDLFMPIIREVEKLSGKVYDQDGDNMSFKVIADHIRSLSFAIGDGALPGNEGRGYVLRRLLRRASMHGQKLGINEPFLYKLVPTVGKIMESYYPEVLEKRDFIEKIVKSEEESFARTLYSGQHFAQGIVADLKEKGQSVIAGQDVFKLYDTYGFPVELTEEIAEEAGMTVDREGFEAAMKEQQERARASAVKGGSMGMQNETLQNITVESVFNHNASQLSSKLVAIVADNAEVEAVSEGTTSLIFAETPFYAEMGGQVADHGQILDESGKVVATVTNVQKAPNGQALHTVEVLAPLALNQEYTLAIDSNRRHRVMKNHTATHLLHAALHNILGNHATQAGSLNEVEFLRFDFTHFQAVTAEELRAIEQQVNEKIWEALEVKTVETDIDTAKEMGAMALFGEKYGKEVRVVTIGDYSIELCGGTHVGNTSEIGLFKIVKEEGIGSGTRRILAVTGKEAFEAYREQEDALKAVAATLKAPQVKEVPHKVEGLQEQLRQLQKENAELKEKAAAAAAGDIFKDVKEVNGHRYIASQVSVSDAGALRTFADNWKQKDYSDLLVLVAAIGDKVNVLVASKTKDLATVTNVQKAPNGQALHTVEVLAPLALNQEYTLAIDSNRRHRVMKNHTATHLLHAALHNILGNHATQAGSLNEVEFLRFDFTHFQAVTAEELRAIEQQVNEKIWEALEVKTVETDIDTAKEMGAMALFGEKYGKEVRVVTIGDYSIELCGGTHVGNTSEIGLFKIVKEEGIGSGTRRILAVTGKEAFEAYREQEDALKAVAATLKAPQVKEVPHKVEGLQEQLRQLQKENAELKEKAAAAAAGDIFKDVKEVNGHRYIASQVSVSDAGALRTFADNWKQKDYSDLLVLVAAIGDKVNVLVASKTKDLHAGNLVKELAPIIDGRGGGKPDMAMAGGSNQPKIQELLDAVAGKL